MIRRLLWGLVAGVMMPAMAAAQEVTFYKDVLPILQRNCQVCHRPGEIGPMAFLTYEGTGPYARAIKTAVATQKMPPWFADRDVDLTFSNGSRHVAQVMGRYDHVGKTLRVERPDEVDRFPKTPADSDRYAAIARRLDPARAALKVRKGSRDRPSLLQQSPTLARQLDTRSMSME